MRLADVGLIVTTPEPTAITDAYALLKLLHADEKGASGVSFCDAGNGGGSRSQSVGPQPAATPHPHAGARPSREREPIAGLAPSALSRKHRTLTERLRVIVNQADGPRDADAVAQRIRGVAQRFLGITPADGGFIRTDKHVRKALMQRNPCVSLYPRSRVSRDLAALTARVLAWIE
jgi:MinD-like ATPase involved in chromosome partitioning or flagellar assembly